MKPEKIRDSPITALKLGAEHRAKLRQIADEKGWDLVQVVRAALDDYHRRTFGRRSADMVPIGLRRGGRGRGRNDDRNRKDDDR